MPDNLHQTLAIIILAAGKGKRMNNPDQAKVMAPLSGKPLIYYVLEVVKKISPERTVLVVGYQKDSIITYVSANYPDIEFAEQSEQLGTGHAVAQTSGTLSDFNGNVLILAGDVPLLTEKTIDEFIENHHNENAAVSVLSVIAPDPTGYGRIIRDENLNFVRITEHKDTNDSEKQICEINSGVFLLPASYLFSSLSELKNNNSQGEYYLTDIIEILRKRNLKVIAYSSNSFDEFQGINTPEDLAKAELYLLKNQ